MWTATETRTIEAFARSLNALKDISFRIHRDSPFSSQDTYWLDLDEIPEPFEPEFSIAVDLEALEDETLIEPADLELVFVIRDRAIQRWEVLRRFDLAKLPEVWGPEQYVLAEFAVPRRLEFVALVVPTRRLNSSPGRAYKPQHVVAERSFEVNLRREGARFPVRIENESWFVDNMMPGDTVWTTRWKRSSVDQVPAEVLDIVINRRFEEPLQRLLANSDVGGAFGAGMAAEILSEVAFTTLQLASDYTDEPTTLQGIVQNRFGIRNQEELDRLKNLAEDTSEALPLLRAYAQSVLGVGDAITKVKVR
jgi:hypothetical protein